MNNLDYLSFKITCLQCGSDKIDHESIHQRAFNVIKNECHHFRIIFIKTFDKIFRLKIIYVCLQCDQIKNYETNLGKFLPNGNVITSQSDSYNCCSHTVQIVINLTENINSNINNFNNNISININNQGNNINYNNMNNFVNEEINNRNNLEEMLKREKEEFENKNIIEFNKKDKILYFYDEKSKKSYKIYSKNEMKIKDVVDDIESQFPELSVKHRKLKIGNRELNLESRINSYSINESDVILMQ